MSSSHCITWYEGSTFFLLWRIVILFSMFEQLSTVYLLHFQCCEIIFQSSFTVKFCWHCFLWDICILFIILSPFMPLSLPSLSFSGILSAVSPTVSVKHSHGQLYLLYLHLFYVQFEFHFYHCLFSFLHCKFIFASWFPFLIMVICVHYCLGLSLRDRKAKKLHTLLSLSKLSNRRKVTNYRQILKEVMWLVTVCLFLNSDLWSENLAVKFVLYAITHS